MRLSPTGAIEIEIEQEFEQLIAISTVECKQISHCLGLPFIHRGLKIYFFAYSGRQGCEASGLRKSLNRMSLAKLGRSGTTMTCQLRPRSYSWADDREGESRPFLRYEYTSQSWRRSEGWFQDNLPCGEKKDKSLWRMMDRSGNHLTTVRADSEKKKKG